MLLKFTGFAWIQRTKVILIQGDAHSLRSAAEWRCLLRLIALAHRLKKPIILWDLPIAQIAAVQRRTSLACAQAIQKTELEMLKLPYPIIAVFDRTDNAKHITPEQVWSDGIVLAASPEAQFSERKNVKIAQRPTDIAPAILELLYQAAAIPTTELVENRREFLRFSAKN